MLTIELGAGVVGVQDSATGLRMDEVAVVAIDKRRGLPFRAGWAALDHEQVDWPFERLALAYVDPDAEPRRCLLGHLIRTALDRRRWWDRVLRPRVTLVVPATLCPAAIQVLRRDAVIAGAARPQVTMVLGERRAHPSQPLRSNG